MIMEPQTVVELKEVLVVGAQGDAVHRRSPAAESEITDMTAQKVIQSRIIGLVHVWDLGAEGGGGGEGLVACHPPPRT